MNEPPKLPTTETTPESSQEIYQRVDDTVGLVPSLRMKDNLWQGIVVGILVVIGTPIGYVFWGWFGALGGALAGLVIGGIGTGTVLMIQGLKRASRK